MRGLRRSLNTQNDAGEFVDLYVLRKCSASNRIIGAKDHASIQMNVAEVSRAAAGPTRWVRGRGRADLHVDSQTSGFDPKVLGHLFTTPFLNF